MGKNKFFIDMDNRPKAELAPGINTIILTGDDHESVMMVLTEVSPGVTVPLHSHIHEQMGMVYSGKATMRIADEERVIEKGDFCNIPANVEHEASCLGDKPFVMLDIFYPVREDFLEKI